LQGKYEPTKVEAKLQDLVRERKLASRMTRENNQLVVSLEIPVTSNPIPGFPASVFVAVAGSDAILVAFEKSTLVDAIARKAAKGVRPGLPVEPYLGKLNLDASFAVIAVPPPSLTVPQAALAGATLVEGSVKFTDGLSVRWTCTTPEGD